MTTSALVGFQPGGRASTNLGGPGPKTSPSPAVHRQCGEQHQHCVLACAAQGISGGVDGWLPATVSWPGGGTGFLVQLSSAHPDGPEGAVAVVLVGGGTRIADCGLRIAAPSAQVRLNLTLTRQGRLDVVERALWAATSHHNVLAVCLTGQQLSPLLPTAVGG